MLFMLIHLIIQGNSSWRYNNDYVEKDDAYRHSKWLSSYMKSRISLAKNLLKDDGYFCINN
jgi:adenine-specific DNA-methyltransferase